MVVLARAAGIPARLAIGYASGIYNLNSRRFIVTQAEAHSWVEVYFPGTGWVPFEPTAGLPAINRTGQLTMAVTPEPSVPLAPPKNAGTGFGNIRGYVGLILVAVVAVTVLLWVIADEIYLRRLKPQLAAREVYRRLRRYGKLLNVPMDGGETLYEFAASLARRLSEITGPGRLAPAVAAVVSASQVIISQIVLVSYHPSHAKAEISMGMISEWRSLRWWLRLMWIIQISNSFQQRFRGWFPRQSKEPFPPVG
jgi:hypothetical protein